MPYQYYPQYGIPYQPPMADQLTQLRQQQYQAPMQQPVMQQAQPTQQPSNSIIWVQGEEGAKAYMVAPGNTVLLMDSDGSSFYLKSADASGMPQPLRIFDYVERPVGAGKRSQANSQSVEQYVTRKEFDALQARFEALAAQSQPAKKSQSKGDAVNA